MADLFWCLAVRCRVRRWKAWTDSRGCCFRSRPPWRTSATLLAVTNSWEDWLVFVKTACLTWATVVSDICSVRWKNWSEILLHHLKTSACFFYLYIKQVYLIQSNFKGRKNRRKSMSVRRLYCSSILVSLRWIVPCVRLFLVFYTDPQKLPDPAGGYKSRASEERWSRRGSVPDGLRTGAHHRAESRQWYQRLWGSADR